MELNNTQHEKKVPKNLYFFPKDIKKWEKFCLDNFGSERVLSKIVTEAMDEYIENFKTVHPTQTQQ